MQADREVRIIKSNIVEVEILLPCNEKDALKIRNELLERISGMNSAGTSYAQGNNPGIPNGHCVTGNAMVKRQEVEKLKTDMEKFIRALKDEGMQVNGPVILVQESEK